MHFSEFKPDIVVHAAAERRPDVVHKQPVQSSVLNVQATSALVDACKKYDAWLIYVSSDYVFDGTAPPYAVDATPNPLSLYGTQKLEGERIVFQELPPSAVLRIPLLYGPIEYLKESAVTSLYEDLLKGLSSADHAQKRYPTYACDVARIVIKMLEAHCTGKRLEGIFHWQSNECLTKYDMVRAICEIESLDASRIIADFSIPKFPRPEDTQLDCSRLTEEVDIDPACFRTPFQDALRTSLANFKMHTVSKRPRIIHEAENSTIVGPVGETCSGKAKLKTVNCVVEVLVG
jgi:dTDP-4-dehydrorhamnose reductase